MKVPNDWPKPEPGKFAIRCQTGWGSGWYLYNSHGRVLTSGGVMLCLEERSRLTQQSRSTHGNQD